MARRLRAWLLLTLFLGAGTSLPGLDALLFHWRADAPTTPVHIEPAGGCGAHAEQCTIGRPPSDPRAFVPLVAAPRFTPDQRVGPGLPPAAPALDPRAATLPLSRAPPTRPA